MTEKEKTTAYYPTIKVKREVYMLAKKMAEEYGIPLSRLTEIALSNLEKKLAREGQLVVYHSKKPAPSPAKSRPKPNSSKKRQPI